MLCRRSGERSLIWTGMCRRITIGLGCCASARPWNETNLRKTRGFLARPRKRPKQSKPKTGRKTPKRSQTTSTAPSTAGEITTVLVVGLFIPTLSQPSSRQVGTRKRVARKRKGHKETHVMVRNAMKAQLHELLTTMKESRTKKVTFKGKKGSAKRKASDISDTDESDHAMEHTPEPSDDESDTLERVQRFLEEEGEKSS